MIYKNSSLAIKDVDTKKGVVSGYFSSFDYKDSDEDIIRKGAYAKSILERGPKSKKDQIAHLLQHNVNNPVGKLQELMEDNYGLYFESLMSKTQLGKDTLIRYEEGIYKEHSVGIVAVKQGFSKEEGANIMTELKLFEGSTVLWGANDQTPVSDIKSLADYKQRLEKFLKNGKVSDEAFVEIEAEYKEITNLYNQLLSIRATEPGSSTQPEVKDAAINYSKIITAFNEGFKGN